MRVLLIGSGGREHALAWALAASPLLGKLYAAPGNAGICEEAECVALDVGDNAQVVAFCRQQKIDFVVVGPEAPLVAGLVDALEAAGIKAFGPSKAAAQLEGSKGFTKDLCLEAGIPTAAYRRFTDLDAARAYVRTHKLPVVVKADGLAAGKGVTVATERAEALDALDAIFADGDASVVVEEFLEGEEASFFALCDGKTVIPFGTAQDHKRAFDGDRGPNTGGMGAYSPAPIMTEAMVARTMAEIVEPTVAALAARGIPYRGVLYAGLMISAEGPKLIEYNVRFGDPECQVADAAPEGRPPDHPQGRGRRPARPGERALARRGGADASCMATKGYPGAYRTGSEIRGLAEAESLPGVKVFHAGTRRDGGRVLAAGGRVLAVTASGATIAEAQSRAYQAVGRIDWPEGFCRRDIGWRAVAPDSAAQG